MILSAEKCKGRSSFRHSWIQDSVLCLLALPSTLWLGSQVPCSDEKAAGSPWAMSADKTALRGKKSLIYSKYFYYADFELPMWGHWMSSLRRHVQNQPLRPEERAPIPQGLYPTTFKSTGHNRLPKGCSKHFTASHDLCMVMDPALNTSHDQRATTVWA